MKIIILQNVETIPKPGKYDGSKRQKQNVPKTNISSKRYTDSQYEELNDKAG